ILPNFTATYRRHRSMRKSERASSAPRVRLQITPGCCWPTPRCRNLCVQHACFEGKKAEETPPRKSTSRTLKWVGQQYPGDLCAPEIGLANHLVRLEQAVWGDGQN